MRLSDGRSSERGGATPGVDLIAQRMREDPLFGQRYTLGPLLGAGGFGRVFEAQQLATGQRVAIKALLVSPDVMSNGTAAKRWQRFEREVRLCARLHHPHIVRLIDAGTVGESLAFAVFEYIPGQTLEHVIDAEGPLSLDESRQLMLQVLDGLSCAHRAGILHRDIKPANIMVTSTGLRRNAMILDFGIGVLVDPSMAADQVQLSSEHHFVGTPRYAAPEQLRGEIVTSRADVYAWGLTFFESLLGRPVFESRSLPQLMLQKQEGNLNLPEDLVGTSLGKLLILATQADVLDRNVTVEGLFAALSPPVRASRQILDAPSIASGETWEDSGEAHTDPASVGQNLTFNPRSLTIHHRGLTSLCVQLHVEWGEAVGNSADVAEVYDSLLRTIREVVVGATCREAGSLAGNLTRRFLLHFTGARAGQGNVERAMRVAFGVLESIGRFHERLRETRGWTVRASMGLAHGRVLAHSELGGAGSRGELSSQPRYAVADEVAIALATCARPGTVVVDPKFADLLGSEYSTVEATLDRPLTETTSVSGALEVLLRARSEAVEQEEHSLPLVGRDTEMTSLRALAEAALDGRGGTALLTGEPGMGKSRLVVALREEFSSRCPTWLEAAGSSVHAQSPLHPVVQIVRTWAGIVGGDAPEVVSKKLDGLVSRLGCDARNAALLLSLVADVEDDTELEAARRLELTIDAVVQLIVAASEGDRRMVLIVEDLHWADPTTLRFIDELVPQVPELGMLLVLTARDGFEPQWLHEVSASVRVQRLPTVDARRLVEALEVVSGGLAVDQVLQRADGVPLFLRELALVAMSSRDPSDGYPNKLETVLEERLDASGPAKRLAQLASVLGREFRYDDLRALAGLEDAELDTQIKMLVDRRLIVRRHRAEVTTYGFRHALVRDAAHDSIVESERRAMHGMVAHRLLDRAPSLAKTHPERLAEHYERAAQFPAAVKSYLAAGTAASRRAANSEAEHHLRRGLALLEGLPPGAERLHMELGLSLSLSGVLMAKEGFSCAEIGRLFGRARSICHELGLTTHLLPVLFGGGAFHIVRAELRQGLELAQTAMDLARTHTDDSMKLPASLALGGTLLLMGRGAEAIRTLEEGLSTYAVEIHRPATQTYSYEPGIAARCYLALGLAQAGKLDAAQALLAQSLEEAREFGHAHTVIHVLIRSCFVRTLLRQTELVTSLADEAITVSRAKGFPLWKANAMMFRGWARAMSGDGSGTGEIRSGIDAWQATGARANVPWFRTLLAESLWKTGSPDEAVAQLDLARAESQATGELLFVSDTCRVQAELLAQQSSGDDARLREARAWLDEARDTASRGDAHLMHLRACRLAVEVPFVDADLRDAAQARLRKALEEISGGADLLDVRLARALI